MVEGGQSIYVPTGSSHPRWGETLGWLGYFAPLSNASCFLNKPIKYIGSPNGTLVTLYMVCPWRLFWIVWTFVHVSPCKLHAITACMFSEYSSKTLRS